MADYNYAGTQPLPYIATAAVVAKTFVKTETTTARGCVTAAAGTDVLVCGVAVSGQAIIGGSVPVQSVGIAQVKAGAAIAAGAKVTSDSTGRAVTVATGDNALGVNWGGAIGAADEIAEILLTPLPNLNGPVQP